MRLLRLRDAELNDFAVSFNLWLRRLLEIRHKTVYGRELVKLLKKYIIH